jgi:hypothetical protein
MRRIPDATPLFSWAAAREATPFYAFLAFLSGRARAGSATATTGAAGSQNGAREFASGVFLNYVIAEA